MLILQTKPIEFIPSKYKNEEKPVTFILQSPTFQTSLKIQRILAESLPENATDKELKPENLKIDTVELIKTVLLDCIIGWKNVFYQDENGELKELEFTKENFMFVNDLEVILELYNKLNELSVPPNEKKKESK